MLGFQAGTATTGFLSWVLGLKLRVVLIAPQVGLKLGVFLLLPLSAEAASMQHLVFFDSPPGISLLLPYAIPECFSLFGSLQNEIKIQLGWGYWLLLVGRNDDVLIFFYLAALLKHLLFVIVFLWICIRHVMGKLQDMGLTVASWM